MDKTESRQRTAETDAADLVEDVWSERVAEADVYVTRVTQMAERWNMPQYQIRLLISDAGMAHPNREQFDAVQTVAMGFVRHVMYA